MKTPTAPIAAPISSNLHCSFFATDIRICAWLFEFPGVVRSGVLPFVWLGEVPSPESSSRDSRGPAAGNVPAPGAALGRVWFALETAWTERLAFWIHVPGSSPCESRSAFAVGRKGAISPSATHIDTAESRDGRAIFTLVAVPRAGRTARLRDTIISWLFRSMPWNLGGVSSPVRVMGCSKVYPFRRHSGLVPPRMCPRTILLLSPGYLGWHAFGPRSKLQNLRHSSRFRAASCSNRDMSAGLWDASHGSSLGRSEEVRKVKKFIADRKKGKKN